jgi:hypothetical protein
MYVETKRRYGNNVRQWSGVMSMAEYEALRVEAGLKS